MGAPVFERAEAGLANTCLSGSSAVSGPNWNLVHARIGLSGLGVPGRRLRLGELTGAFRFLEA